MRSTQSLWRSEPMDPAPPLDRNMSADVAVIGAGIAGLSIAYHLAREGVSVVVLDRAQPGSGMTGQTTAHLSYALDDRYYALLERRGHNDTCIVAESMRAAIDSIDNIQREEEIDCDFARLDGFLYPAQRDKPDMLRRERDAARRAELTGVELARGPVRLGGGADALRFPHQARFHPLKYLKGLQRCITRDQGQIFGQTAVVSVSGGKGAALRTESGHLISAGQVVIATNCPINSMAIHTKQAPYRTYVIAARIPRGRFPDALIWDNEDPYHYVRLQPGDDTHDFIIAGGEDHKTGHAADGAARIERLYHWTRTIAPEVGELEYAWSGQVMEPHDFVGFIGRTAMDQDSLFMVTGDSGMGMTHGALAGILIADLIHGRENSWTELYDPHRVTPRAAGTFIKENVDALAHMSELLAGGDIARAEDLPPGQGGVLREGMHKVAVHRSQDGVIRRKSAACRHMGCVVAWNPFAESWDCPCHGSIYAADGSVLNAPAVKPLADAP